MDSCKFYCCVYFLAAMGLAACFRGEVTISDVTVATPHVDRGPSSPVKATILAEMDAPPSSSSSRMAPGSTATPTVGSTVAYKNEICAAQLIVCKDELLWYKMALLLEPLMLVIILALSCWVCHLQGRMKAKRLTHANGEGYRAAGQEATCVGVAETCLELEEVKLVKDGEETAEPDGPATASEPEPDPAADPKLEPEPGQDTAPQTTPSPTSESASDEA